MIEAHIEAVKSIDLGVVRKAADKIRQAISNGGKILLIGNGGSAADCQHFAAELVGRFKKERGSLPAIALTTDTSIITAIANDYGYDQVFARQIQALAKPEDILIAISTSGKSTSVINGIACANCFTIGLTGNNPMNCDINITVKTDITARIQECHILILHMLCEIIEG